MKKSIGRLGRLKTGAALVEYVVLMGLIGVTSMGMVLSMGEGVRDVFGDSQVSLASATDQAGSTDLGDTEVAEVADDGACYTVTSDTDFYDPAYTCYEIDPSLEVYPDYTAETSDNLTITFTPPSSAPGSSGPRINIENGELIWDNSGPHASAYFGTTDTDTWEPITTGNVSITFPSLSCDNLDVYYREFDEDDYSYYIDVDDGSRIWFDESLDTLSCLNPSTGTLTSYDDPVDNYLKDEIALSDSFEDVDGYILMDGQVFYSWDTYMAGDDPIWDPVDGYANIPARVTWKKDSYGYVTYDLGEYCLYYIDAGYYITGGGVGYCESRSELEEDGVGESLIDDIPYSDYWYDQF
jgi:Flp pilus assembly pilin Flp